MKQKDTDHDWTYNKTEKELIDLARGEIYYSQEVKKVCKKYKIPFYNTAFDRDKTIETIIEDIKKNGEKKEIQKPPTITDLDWKLLKEKYRKAFKLLNFEKLTLKKKIWLISFFLIPNIYCCINKKFHFV